MRTRQLFVRRSLSAIACGAAIVLFCATPAFADGQETGVHSNIVQAENSDSSRPVVRTGVVGALDEGTSVTDTNIAYAHSFNCTGCRTVAVAIQVVVFEGSPTNFQPQNGAVAVNETCQSCQTFAYAHQYLIQAMNGFRLPDGSYEQLAQIQWKISQVARSNVDFVTMSSQLDQLSLQLYNTAYQAVQNQNGDVQKSDERRQVQEND
jgi:hypothetical protein